MARLLEFEGKQLLALHGIAVPQGAVCRTAEECRQEAARLGGDAVVKAQVRSTQRAAAGLVSFDVAACAGMLARASAVLVEQRLPIEHEFYAAVVVDDTLRRPLLLFSAAGGTGVEDRSESVAQLPLSVTREPDLEALQELARRAGAPDSVADVLLRLYRVAQTYEARTVEVNPLVLSSGNWVALDCRISVDDYAVFRHPELGIDVARELDHEPTALDRIAWEVERDDYRGTFYFIETPENANDGGIRIGFMGAGGGGSMASLDVAASHGLCAADFADTSGNPPASKVYRAARIILSQPGLRGFFLSGPGAASQEQYNFARALVKAFREEGLSVPAVLRLGGNGEELAVRIIQRYAEESGARVEGYTKEYSADFCAARLRDLIEQGPTPAPQSAICNLKSAIPYAFATRTGTITYDHAICQECESKACVATCPPQILTSPDGLPVLNITVEDAQRGKCTECLACEVECWYQGKGGARIDLPIPGLSEYRKTHGHPD